MHTWSRISAGFAIGPHDLELGPAPNERYWRAAGLEHPVLAEGAAYPLIAANCTVLAWLATCPEPMIQTRQHLRCHRIGQTPLTLRTEGAVIERFERRGRDYITIRVEVAGTNADSGSSDGPLWTSEVDFTPVATVARPTPPRPTTPRGLSHEVAGVPSSGGIPPVRGTPLALHRRELTITDEHIRQYSRRGNYHSEASTAEDLGLPGLVAQGTQVCGPAFAMLLNEWGAPCLERGTFDARFIGMVLGGDTIAAEVAVHEHGATFTVENLTRGGVSAVGTATRHED